MALHLRPCRWARQAVGLVIELGQNHLVTQKFVSIMSVQLRVSDGFPLLVTSDQERCAAQGRHAD